MNPTKAPPPRIGIFGIGNVLLADDGWGPYLIRLLEAHYEFPENVELRDLGAPGQDLALDLAGLDFLIMLDSVQARGQPGDLCRFGKDEILRRLPDPRLGSHDPSFKEALLLTELRGNGPGNAVLIGVIPDNLDLGTRLSDAIRRSLPEAQAMVVEELSRIGCAVKKRTPSLEPEIWWEVEPDD